MLIQKNINDIASDIARTECPAMMIDTCVSLDIIRCLSRENVRIIKIARQLIEAHENGEILMYAHSHMQAEADRNRSTVQDDARKAAEKIDEAMDLYRNAASCLGVERAPSYHHTSVIAPLVALYERLLSTCVHVSDTSMWKAAFGRSIAKRRPAKQGSSEVVDCLMFEEFLSIAQVIPNAAPLVLFTVNTDDFGDKSQKPVVVHQELSDDLSGTNAEICLNWDLAAKLMLRKDRLGAT
jgi:hypothetical protein